MPSARIRWDPKGIRALRVDPQVVAYVEQAGEDFARELRLATPRDSGAAAASIDSRPARAKGGFDVGWDAEHFYLFFPEFGTIHQPAQRFARDVLARYTFT